MEMNTSMPETKRVIAAWDVLHAALGLATPIADEAAYERLLEFSERLANSLPDEDSPTWGLVRLMVDRIREYEDRVHPIADAAPHEMLQYLMAEHGLKQHDLPEIGPQSVISNILAGKRKLNARQIGALAKRFHVSADVFL
jgi:HTH-type transcriptional regulator/antitoxin HigA